MLQNEAPRVSIEFNAQSTAPTLDDIRTRKLAATPNIIEAADIIVKNSSNVKQFNFGELNHRSINEAVTEGFDFIEYGCFQLPYPFCFYRTSIVGKDGDRTVGESYFVVSSENGLRAAVTMFLKSQNGHMMATHCVVNLKTALDPNSMKRALPLEVPNEEIAFWGKHIVTDNGAPTPNELADGGLTVVGLTMIVNTKGVYKERRAPPEKPNKARLKKGLPPLPYVTRVHTALYNRASEPGTGTHASPRPHRRRAHIRTYRNEDGSVNRHTPIAAMLVNWDGTPVTRSAYEVK